MSTVLLYKWLPIIVYSIAVIGAIASGYLVYSGLSSRYEKMHHRLRVRESLLSKKEQFVTYSNNSQFEEMLRLAGYPLGINALRYNIIHLCLFAFLLLNYIVAPYVSSGTFSTTALIIIVLLFLMTTPAFPYAIVYYLLKRLGEYQKAKRNAELFVLYDLLISEIQMMNTSRINAYNLLRGLRPYFTQIEGSLNRLITNWTKDAGHIKALDDFAAEMGTTEAEALVTVLKTFDENARSTILTSLKGMEEVFANAQIENYRRRRKLFIDLARIPIKTGHFLIILNFVVIIVYMVSYYMNDAKL